MTTSRFSSILRASVLLPFIIAATILCCGIASADEASEAAQAIETATDGASITTVVNASGSLGLKYIAAAISVGLGSLAAATAVGKIGSAAMGAAAEKPELVSKSIVLVGLGEGIALFGFLVSIFLLNA